jgi:hypothetical protein
LSSICQTKTPRFDEKACFNLLFSRDKPGFTGNFLSRRLITEKSPSTRQEVGNGCRDIPGAGDQKLL